MSDLAISILRLITKLYPRSFREEFSEEMEATLADMLERCPRQNPWERFSLIVREGLGLAHGATYEWSNRFRGFLPGGAAMLIHERARIPLVSALLLGGGFLIASVLRDILSTNLPVFFMIDRMLGPVVISTFLPVFQGITIGLTVYWVTKQLRPGRNGSYAWFAGMSYVMSRVSIEALHYTFDFAIATLAPPPIPFLTVFFLIVGAGAGLLSAGMLGNKRRSVRVVLASLAASTAGGLAYHLANRAVMSAMGIPMGGRIPGLAAASMIYGVSYFALGAAAGFVGSMILIRRDAQVDQLVTA